MSSAGSTLGSWSAAREPIMTCADTVCPPSRCSSMMRSSTKGVSRSYHTPSGYTTAMGPWQGRVAASAGSRFCACWVSAGRDNRAGQYAVQQVTVSVVM